MKVLCITNIFPDASRPEKATYTKLQLVHLAREHEVRVIAPVAWPYKLYLALKGKRIVPLDELRGKMEVHHPTYYYTPGSCRFLYGFFYYASIFRTFERLVKQDRPDIVYSTWAYPDCYAAVRAAGRRSLPAVVRIHGSDINKHLGRRASRRFILQTMREAGAVVSISGDIKRQLVSAGVDGSKIHVLFNGIDGGVFHPIDRSDARRELGLDGGAVVITYVGALKRDKGIFLLVDAFERLEGDRLHLYIIGGEGPDGDRLRSRVNRSTCRERITLCGSIEHSKLGTWFNASDLSCLPSYFEGTPNVVLESLACATPVVATDTGGIPEVISDDNGILFRRGSADSLVEALKKGLAREWDRERIRCPVGSWDENAVKLSELFRSTIEAFKSGH